MRKLSVPRNPPDRTGQLLWVGGAFALLFGVWFARDTFHGKPPTVYALRFYVGFNLGFLITSLPELLALLRGEWRRQHHRQ